jgi:hypothetical protein
MRPKREASEEFPKRQMFEVVSPLFDLLAYVWALPVALAQSTLG